MERQQNEELAESIQSIYETLGALEDACKGNADEVSAIHAFLHSIIISTAAFAGDPDAIGAKRG